MNTAVNNAVAAGVAVVVAAGILFTHHVLYPTVCFYRKFRCRCLPIQSFQRSRCHLDWCYRLDRHQTILVQLWHLCGHVCSRCIHYIPMDRCDWNNQYHLRYFHVHAPCYRHCQFILGFQIVYNSGGIAC